MNTLRPISLRAGRAVRMVKAPYFRSYSSPSSSYEYIITSTPKPGVGQITLNRPKKLNALCTPLFVELNDALAKFDADQSIGAMVLTGSEKAFAAGADIAEMKDLTFAEAYKNNFIELWTRGTSSVRKPLVAAVNGFALGGGCELAMMADVIYTSTGAKFGQPEIALGVIPGAGGSQRLTRAIGKSRAMELILTGNQFTGKQAAEWGLAAQVFDSADECLEGALKTAEKIAGFSNVAVVAAKEVVNKSQELSLKEGVDFERRLFHGLFGSQDQTIGMTAFVEKGKPEWKNE